MRRIGWILVVIVALAFSTADVALADMMLVGPVDQTGTGFGHVTTIMTMQATGQNQTGSEQGCSGWDGSAAIIGLNACAPAVVSEDETQPAYTGGDSKGPAGFPKNQVLLLSDLGISNANQIAIIFNPDQSGPAHGITLTDLTITLWDNSTGNLLWNSGDITGGNGPGGDSNIFASTDPGVGKTGFEYVLTATQAAALDGLHLNFSQTRIGLSASASGVNGGPDSFQVAQVVPEPKFFFVSLAGLALTMTIAQSRRRRRV